ncbi:MAG TPA: NUDIX hydrolase [Streptosporangiaceae bacterium]|nr:NUDIX hydrolase [Streptosporangiaceae bacterium]
MAEADHREAASTPDVPSIPVSTGALIFDHSGRLLILKPTYKSGWTIPGGIMEADGESPWQACRREIREECGIDIESARLACVDFRPMREGNPGGVRFLFDCGAVPDSTLDHISLQAEEISEHLLAPMPEALTLLRKPIRRRVRAVRKRTGDVRTRAVVYLENGRRVRSVHPRPAKSQTH